MAGAGGSVSPTTPSSGSPSSYGQTTRRPSPLKLTMSPPCAEITAESRSKHETIDANTARRAGGTWWGDGWRWRRVLWVASVVTSVVAMVVGGDASGVWVAMARGVGGCELHFAAGLHLLGHNASPTASPARPPAHPVDLALDAWVHEQMERRLAQEAEERERAVAEVRLE